ncbi:uncharacterized protein LOC143209190 [Lasioglossum baleicum]|uniref:uncharacterized protein LOC143209190 n=1 Tax=Lasioglossum baleicum TaxID=434251 RepID=UPI003FCC6B89
MDDTNSKNISTNSQCKYSDQICAAGGTPDDNEHDWWASDSGSCTGSYYSDTDSSAAEWESEISPTGELFYIESAAESIVDGQSLYNESEHDSQPKLTRRST